VTHGFNILGARIHTWANGVVMDTFQVESLEASGFSLDPELLERMRQDLAAVLEGKTDLKQLLSQRALPPLVRADRYPAMNPRLKIDNRSSDFYTVLELRANDRFGLLFAITTTLAELGLDIHLALIDTRRGQVVDVFYVQELTGQKLLEGERLALVEREIYRALERLESAQLPEKTK
jgi:[protein-PII] uridylyltransferase